MLTKHHARRRFIKRMIATAATLSQSTLVTRLRADDTVTKPLAGKVVQWIVPFSAGGGFDVYSRLLEPFLEKTLDAQIVVKNVPGGGGIVGSKWLMGAAADGRTLALINAPGLLVASLTGVENVPNPVKDFTVLGRISQDKKVWAVGRDSTFHNIQDVLDEAKHRPISFGITGVGSPNFTCIAVGSHLLGIDPAYVAGFSGSREASFSAIRGEVELVSFNYESVLDLIDSGDLRPLLQITTAPISDHKSLKAVPLLGGDDGLAARIASRRGSDPKEADADAASLASLMGAGRLVVAPLGMDQDIFINLEHALHMTLTDPAFVESAGKANRSLNVADSADALGQLRIAAERLDRFLPIVKQAIATVRQ